MNKEQLPLYAVALAVLIVGLAFAGVPLSALFVLPIVLICPLTMFFMMRGKDHGSTAREKDDHEHHDGAR